MKYEQQGSQKQIKYEQLKTVEFYGKSSAPLLIKYFADSELFSSVPTISGVLPSLSLWINVETKE